MWYFLGRPHEKNHTWFMHLGAWVIVFLVYCTLNAGFRFSNTACFGSRTRFNFNMSLKYTNNTPWTTHIIWIIYIMLYGLFLGDLLGPVFHQRYVYKRIAQRISMFIRNSLTTQCQPILFNPCLKKMKKTLCCISANTIFRLCWCVQTCTLQKLISRTIIVWWRRIRWVQHKIRRRRRKQFDESRRPPPFLKGLRNGGYWLYWIKDA